MTYQVCGLILSNNLGQQGVEGEENCIYFRNGMQGGSKIMQCSDWRKAKKASILLYTIYTPCGKSGEKERKRVPACMCELSTITLTAHCASLVSTLLCASTRGRSVPSSQYLCQVGLDSRPLLRPHWASVLSRDPISCYLIGCGRFATHPPHTPLCTKGSQLQIDISQT